MTEGRRYGDLALYRRLLREARPFWHVILGLLIFQLLAAPLALLNPIPLKIAVDSVIGTEPLPAWLSALLPGSATADATGLLAVAAIMLVLLALLEYLRILAVWLLSAYSGNSLILTFRAKLFAHMQQLSFTYHDNRGAMDSIYRIQYDTVSIQQAANHGVIPFISNIAMLVAMVWVTMRIDPVLAGIALCTIPPLFLLTNVARKIIKRQWESLKAKESSAISVVQETLGALRVVKAFGKETAARERFEARSDKVVKDQLRVAFTEGSFDLFIGLTLAIGSAAVLLVGIQHVRAGTITLGELLLVMGYLAQLYSPLQTITKTIAQLQSAMAGAQRVFSVLDERPQVIQRPNARALVRARGDLEFRNVSFGYEPGNLVLQSTSFRIPAGTRLGIFGPTGAGKTSLVSLLLRFYDPSHGSILLDGVDLKDYVLADLRNQYSMVLQDSVLFSASIAENIAYSRPDASHDGIVQAAMAANAHEFIVALPEGYETTVGERGMRLSGGERQRIALARAFLRDSPILVLDEPTSALDAGTERLVIDALDRLMKGRTTLMIAHRISTLQSCDMWLKLERGQPAQLLHTPPTLHDVTADRGQAIGSV